MRMILKEMMIQIKTHGNLMRTLMNILKRKRIKLKRIVNNDTLNKGKPLEKSKGKPIRNLDRDLLKDQLLL